jgi:chromosome segregation ATPase
VLLQYQRSELQLEAVKYQQLEQSNERLREGLESAKTQLQDSKKQVRGAKKDFFGNQATIAELRLKIHDMEDEILELQVCFPEWHLIFKIGFSFFPLLN